MCDTRSFPKHFVYKYVDNDTGAAVYVGKTNASLKARIDAHRRDPRFFSYLENTTIFCAQFPTSDDTDAAELSLISELSPELNTAFPGVRASSKYKDGSIDWDLCDDVLKLVSPNPQREVVLRKRAQLDMRLIGSVVEALCRDGMSNGSEFLTDFLHPSGVVFCGDTAVRLVGKNVKKSGDKYLQVLEIPDNFEGMLKQMEFSAWLPVAQVHSFSKQDMEEFDSLSRLFDFSYRLKRSSEGVDDGDLVKMLIGKEALVVVAAWEPIFDSILWRPDGVCEAEFSPLKIQDCGEIYEDIASQGVDFFKRTGVIV